MPHAKAYTKNDVPLVSGVSISAGSRRLGGHVPSGRCSWMTFAAICLCRSTYFCRVGQSLGRYCSTRTVPPITQPLPRDQKIFLPFFVALGGKKFLSR